MPAYYNEIDPYAAQWLRNLIAAGHIAPGDVDERSILDVKPDDLRSYDQCHFFAGIGGWSYALRLAGWPDDRPVWTGSCPCQPFSAAGKQRGSDDERHLWPAFFDLIRERNPASVFGEQVAGAAGLAWLDHVCADLEGAGYAAAAANLCAAGAGAPHIRQRLYWVAHADEGRSRRDAGTVLGTQASSEWSMRREPDSVELGGSIGGMAYPDGRHASAEGLQRSGQHGQQPQDGGTGILADRAEPGRSQQPQWHGGAHGRQAPEPGRLRDAGRSSGALDAWADLEWIECSDGKARPTQPGLFPLAHGVSNRVGRLRAYGNAIVPQVAAVFVMANVEMRGGL